MDAGKVLAMQDHYGMPDKFLPGFRKEIPSRLIRCLNQNAVRYEILHEPDWPGQIQESVNVRGFIHTAVVRAGKRRLLAVLTDGRNIDLKRFARLLGEPVRLETEDEFKWLFPDCALGAIPPFGNLYGLATWVDSSLAKTEYVIFKAGTLIDWIKITYSAYIDVVKPNIGEFFTKSFPDQ